MPKYTIDLPDELVEIIEAEGYDVNSYVDTMLVKPLVDRLIVKLEAKEVKKARKQIDDSVDAVKEKVKIKEVKLSEKRLITKSLEYAVIEEVS